MAKGAWPLVFELLTLALFCLSGCTFENPAERSGDKSEYDYNYWLLERIYYFDDLPAKELFTEPESLYAAIPDKYTRYVPPVKAEATEQAMTTSINNGTIGIELDFYGSNEYPISVYRVYPGGPASRAGMPRYAVLMEANGTSLKNCQSTTDFYKAIANVDSATVTYAFNNDTVTVTMPKESVYEPTVFLDTLFDGSVQITLRKFASTTSNRIKGTAGELDSIVNILDGFKGKVVIDIRNNPGGVVSQCVTAADFFVKEGVLLKINSKGLRSSGNGYNYWESFKATPGHKGEDLDILLFTNGNSASCAEIFTMAMKLNPKVKSIGTTTYGKGIGQTSKKTSIGALVYITNMMVYNGNKETYHGKGIEPDAPCERADAACVFRELQPTNIRAKSADASLGSMDFPEPAPVPELFGGAIFDLDTLDQDSL